MEVWYPAEESVRHCGVTPNPNRQSRHRTALPWLAWHDMLRIASQRSKNKNILIQTPSAAVNLKEWHEGYVSLRNNFRRDCGTRGFVTHQQDATLLLRKHIHPSTCISKAMPSTHVALRRKQEGGEGQEAHTLALKEGIGPGAAGALQRTKVKTTSYHHACAAAAEPHRLLPRTAPEWSVHFCFLLTYSTLMQFIENDANQGKTLQLFSMWKCCFLFAEKHLLTETCREPTFQLSPT